MGGDTTSSSAACNRHHSVEQRLCRWLLLTLDRCTSNELVMTQELIATMLGVRNRKHWSDRRPESTPLLLQPGSTQRDVVADDHHR
jgi:hypothetical protein